MKWDAVSRRNYEQAVLTPSRWFKNADDLLRSARLLRPRAASAWRSWQEYAKTRSGNPKIDHYTAPYLMLIAYAIENLLKGALIARDSAAMSADAKFQKHGFLPDVLCGHDLLDLATELNLTLDPRATEALLRLERSSVWAGRYPVPLHYRNTSNTRVSGGKAFNVGYLSSSELDYLLSLVADLRRQLQIGELPSEYRMKRIKKRKARAHSVS